MKKVLLENALLHLFILLSACAVDSANSGWNHRVVVRTPFFEDQCRVDVLPNPETFRKQHFLFIGDSVTRYSYLNFAYYLDNAEFPPHVQDEARPSLSNEHTWPGWKDFYLQTTATFNGKERCDCYRQETGYNPSKIYENRYYNKSSAQITSTYLQLFGYHDMAIRNPIGAHSAQNLSRTYGWSSPDKAGSFDTMLPHVAAHLPPATTVILNSGAWQKIATNGPKSYFVRLLDSVESIAPTNATLVWRTTTYATLCDSTVLEILSQRKAEWHVLDANAMVVSLKNQGVAPHWDNRIHLHGFVYEEILRQVLGLLLGQCKTFTTLR